MVEQNISNDDIYLDLAWLSQSSIFYHHEICDKFEFRQRCVNILNLFLSAGAVLGLISILKDKIPHLSVICSSILALINSIAFAMDYANRGRLHHDLATEWIRLKADVDNATIQSDENKKRSLLIRCQSRIAELNSKEPPTKKYLSFKSEFRAARVLGLNKPYVPWYFKVHSKFW